MVSRRKILSRSTDDLNLEAPGLNEPEEEDVWFNKDKLYKVGKDQQFRARDFFAHFSQFFKSWANLGLFFNFFLSFRTEIYFCS